jgi:hypothetical protein
VHFQDFAQENADKPEKRLKRRLPTRMNLFIRPFTETATPVSGVGD